MFVKTKYLFNFINLHLIMRLPFFRELRNTWSAIVRLLTVVHQIRVERERERESVCTLFINTIFKGN